MTTTDDAVSTQAKPTTQAERGAQRVAEILDREGGSKRSGPTQASVFKLFVSNPALMSAAVWRQERGEWWLKQRSGIWEPEDCDQMQGSIHRLVSGGNEWQIAKGTTAGLLSGVKNLLHPVLAKPPGIFDRDPWLFGVGNGIVDLRTQTLIDDVDQHYITRCSPINYVPGAVSDEWLDHIDMLFDDDDELAHCFQKQIGAALVGDAETCKPQVFLQLLGPSGGGKGTTTHTLRYVLGSYAVNLSSEDLAAGHDRHKQWLTSVRGARVVIVEEMLTDALNIELLKKLSGGDSIVANEMREADKEWIPTHTLLFTSNTEPNFGGDADGMQRRYVPLPTGPERWHDSDLDGKYGANLRTNPEGILAWCIEGGSMWQKEDSGGTVKLPATVVELRDANIAGHSEYQSFIDDCLVLDPNEVMWRSQVRPLFGAWLAEHNDFTPLEQNKDKRLQKVYDILNRTAKPGKPYVGPRQERGWFGVYPR